MFVGNCLLGALSFSAGPFNAYFLVQGATPDDCITLSRLWLHDALPKNSESRVLGVVLRALRHHTGVKFLITYADPAQGHMGTIYQATGWVYTGLSEAMPLYQVEGGKVRRSRSLSHAYGTHSVKHFAGHGVDIAVLPRAPKHRYLSFLDPAWRSRLRLASLAYPKSTNALNVDQVNRRPHAKREYAWSQRREGAPWGNITLRLQPSSLHQDDQTPSGV